MLYEIRINQVPISFNAWQSNHWAKNARLKKKWIEELWIALYAAKVPKCLAHVVLSAEVVFNINRVRDTDNYAATFFKMTQDGLQQLGYVLNDNPTYVTMGAVTLTVSKSDKPHTKVRLDATEGRHVQRV